MLVISDDDGVKQVKHDSFHVPSLGSINMLHLFVLISGILIETSVHRVGGKLIMNNAYVGDVLQSKLLCCSPGLDRTSLTPVWKTVEHLSNHNIGKSAPLQAGLESPNYLDAQLTWYKST